jgi:hypothetical protein
MAPINLSAQLVNKPQRSLSTVYKLNHVSDVLEGYPADWLWHLVEHFKSLDEYQSRFFIALVGVRVHETESVYLVPLLAAFKRLQSLRSLAPPQISTVSGFVYVHQLPSALLSAGMEDAFRAPDAAHMAGRTNEREKELAQAEWRDRCCLECNMFAHSIIGQWPSPTPVLPAQPAGNRWLNVSHAQKLCVTLWEAVYKHNLITVHIKRIQDTIDGVSNAARAIYYAGGQPGEVAPTRAAAVLSFGPGNSLDGLAPSLTKSLQK